MTASSDSNRNTFLPSLLIIPAPKRLHRGLIPSVRFSYQLSSLHASYPRSALLAVSLLVAQFLLSVDVLSVLVATTGIVISYSSLSASVLLLFTYFVTRSTSQLSSLLGILVLVVAFDTASSSAILSL